jgi:hypothetical protein
MRSGMMVGACVVHHCQAGRQHGSFVRINVELAIGRKAENLLLAFREFNEHGDANDVRQAYGFGLVNG